MRDPLSARRRTARRRRATGTLLALFFAGNVVAITWLWVHGGNLHPHTTGDLLTGIGRLTGLLGAYLALVQVILLARLPALERLVGFDRLTVWHRWNGHVCIDLIVAHVVFTVWGYSLLDKIALGSEISTMLGGGIYPGMITATIGTGLLIAVVATSLVIVRRRLRYEWWYAVHLMAYAGIALSWFHEIPTGNELVLHRVAADYWRGALPRHDRDAGRLAACWCRSAARFATGCGSPRWRSRAPESCRCESRGATSSAWARTPGSSSSGAFSPGEPGAPRTRSRCRRRPTAARCASPSRALGDHTARIAQIEPGTRVLAEGPFGVFTDDRRRGDKAVLIAGGIGITPIRALVETMKGDLIVLYRVMAEQDVIFRDELDALAAAARRSSSTTSSATTTATAATCSRRRTCCELVPDLDRARRLPLRPACDDRRSSARTSATPASRDARSTPNASP